MASDTVFAAMVNGQRMAVSWRKHRRRSGGHGCGPSRACLLVVSLFAGPLAMAQVDLSGTWAARLHEDSQAREAGPNQVEYYGMPINGDARARALSTTPTFIDVPEHQCVYYGPFYLLLGPFALQISHQDDPVTGRPISWTIGPWVDRAPMTIWVDGRSHPGPQAHGERLQHWNLVR